MINLLTGAPKAGKSYYLVYIYLEKYFDKTTNTVKKGYTVISNIKGFILPHIKLERVIEKYKKEGEKDHNAWISRFFNKEEQEKLYDQYGNIVYMIDECHIFFNRKLNDEQVFDFFAWHEHLGIEIYLATQMEDAIHPRIKGLNELHIHAVKRSHQFFGKMIFQVLSHGEVLEKIYLKKDKRLFMLYKAFDKETKGVIKNPLARKLVLCLIGIAIAFIFFYITFVKKNTTVNSNSKKSVKSLITGQTTNRKRNIESSEKTEQQTRSFPKRLPPKRTRLNTSIVTHISEKGTFTEIFVLYDGEMINAKYIPDRLIILGSKLYVETDYPELYRSPITIESAPTTEEMRRPAEGGSISAGILENL